MDGKYLLCVMTVLAATLACSNARGAQDVELTVRNPGALIHPSWPVTTGVPFPKGAIEDASQLTLLDAAGAEVAAQRRVTATWGQNGAPRWVLLDFQTPLGGEAQKTYTLRIGEKAPRPVPRTAIKVEQTAGEIRLDTGAMAFTVRRDRFDGLHAAVRTDGKTALGGDAPSGPYFIAGDGRTFRAAAGAPDEVVLEESGPFRAVLCAKGWFYGPRNEKSCQYVVRIHAYAGQPFVKILYTIIITERSDAGAFNDIGFHFPITTTNVCFGGDGASPRPVPGQDAVYLLQYDSDKALVASASKPGAYTDAPTVKQARGWATASGPNGDMTLACRDFWQQFPKELEANGKALTFHVWPAHGVAKPDRKVSDDMLQYLWFCHEGKTLRFKMPESYVNYRSPTQTEYASRYLRGSAEADVLGLAKTHELLLWFHDPEGAPAVQKAAEAWQSPPTALAAPEWVCASGAFGRIHPYDPRRFPDIEKALEKAWDCERRLQAQSRDYGMFNWGDAHTSWDFKTNRWDDLYRVWRGFHHNAPLVSWILYARSGEPKYLDHAIRNARHLMDIDVCHYTTPEVEALPYPRGKIVGALTDYKGIAHWNAGNRLFDYNALTDFMFWYYYLTGDRRGWDVALEWGESAKKNWVKPLPNRTGAGSAVALMGLYEATWDPEYRRLAYAIVNNFLDNIQVMAPDRPMFTLASGVNILQDVPYLAGKKMPVGAFAEWENYASWLDRYYDLSGDKRAGDRIVAWANAYLSGCGDGFTTSESDFNMNILAYAYFVSEKPIYLEAGLDRALRYTCGVQDTPGRPMDGFPYLAQMSLGHCYATSRIPVLLAALASYGKPVHPNGRAGGTPFRLPALKDTTGRHIDAVVRKEKDTAFAILGDCGHQYKDWSLQVRVTSPTGKAVLDQSFPSKDGSLALSVTVPADGVTGDYRLSMTGNGNYWNMASTLRTQPAMKIVYPLDGRPLPLAESEYYFLVPAGVRALRVSAEGSTRPPALDIVDPDGKTVLRMSVFPDTPEEKKTVRVEVPQPHTGRLWRLVGRGGMAPVRIAGEGAEVPPYLAVDPGSFFVPAAAK